MHFLIDASLPRSTADVLRRLGHTTTDVRDIGMRRAADPKIAEHARSNGQVIISADFDFADIRNYPPSEYPGIVVVEREEGALIDDVLAIVERFASDTTSIAAIPGRLAIISRKRIRIRPTPLSGGAGNP